MSEIIKPTWVVVRGHTLTTHAVYAAGDEEDGSLYGFNTRCGLWIGEDYEQWRELPDSRDTLPTCMACSRYIEGDKQPNSAYQAERQALREAWGLAPQ